MHLRAVVAAGAAVVDEGGEEHVAALVVHATEACAALLPNQRRLRGRGVRAERPRVARWIGRRRGGLGGVAGRAPVDAGVARVRGGRQGGQEEELQHHHCETAALERRSAGELRVAGEAQGDQGQLALGQPAPLAGG